MDFPEVYATMRDLNVMDKCFHFTVRKSWKCVPLIFHLLGKTLREERVQRLSLLLFSLYLVTSKCKPHGKVSLSQYDKYSIKPNLPSLRSIITYNVHVVPRHGPLMSLQKTHN